ncbi:hypothetical protein V6N13_038346 [Hibiscus sabdariffa]|uniref:Uncharacterized protein n=1 Tax=Hibiscus sabdariffa TaxID=183260 RepID=A0ABR2S2P5_9ROSI
MSSLEMLSLAGNRFSGKLPHLSNTPKIEFLDLSRNVFSGNISPRIETLPKSMQLSLSKNKLTCEIPEALSSYKNEFFGEAGKMESLVQVNISHNHLTGALPSTGAFLVINETAVVGNNLCDSDFPSCKKLKNRAWWVLIACSLAALLLLVVAAFGFLFINGRNNLELERAKNEDRSIWELQFFDSTASKSITTDEGVVVGESNVDEEWVVGEGFGFLF